MFLKLVNYAVVHFCLWYVSAALQQSALMCVKQCVVLSSSNKQSLHVQALVLPARNTSVSISQVSSMLFTGRCRDCFLSSVNTNYMPSVKQLIEWVLLSVCLLKTVRDDTVMILAASYSEDEVQRY